MNIQRKKVYIEFLNSRTIASWKELSKLTKVSELTVRRDMKRLSDARLVSIGAGGVEVITKTSDTVLSSRSNLNSKIKEVIAKKAASLIKNKDIIFIDAGSTTEKIIQYIRVKELTIVTNGLNIAKVSLVHGFKTIFISGEIKPKTLASIGEDITKQLEKLYFLKCFIGSNGASIKQGYSTPDIREAIIKEAVINNSKDAFIVMDSSKFGVDTLARFAKLQEVKLITNKVPSKYFGKVVEYDL